MSITYSTCEHNLFNLRASNLGVRDKIVIAAVQERSQWKAEAEEYRLCSIEYVRQVKSLNVIMQVVSAPCFASARLILLCEVPSGFEMYHVCVVQV